MWTASPRACTGSTSTRLAPVRRPSPPRAPTSTPKAISTASRTPAARTPATSPNLTVNANGVGHLDATTDRVTLSPGDDSLFDANGSAFIIHANTDDQVTDATNGNSGARIACAVISAD